VERATHTLRIHVEGREIVLTGVLGTMVVYGIHEGQYHERGQFFLTIEAQLSSFSVLHGSENVAIHRLDAKRSLLIVKVSGTEAKYALEVESSGK